MHVVFEPRRAGISRGRMHRQGGAAQRDECERAGELGEVEANHFGLLCAYRIPVAGAASTVLGYLPGF